jgi:hypothetical protein
MIERIKMARAIEITGENARTLRAAAAAGLIPGAARPFKCWTFDEARLRAWLKTKERRPRATSGGENRRYARSPVRTAGSRLPFSPASEARYQQAIDRLRNLAKAKT